MNYISEMTVHNKQMVSENIFNRKIFHFAFLKDEEKHVTIGAGAADFFTGVFVYLGVKSNFRERF